MKFLPQSDPIIYQAIKNELTRQRIGLEMIASENLVSPAVLEAMGTVLTNKYSEGYPGKRYYSGNEFIDIVEQTAIDRAKELFGAPHANVQPHSGSQANAEAYFAILNPGDKILAMNLSHGGHLTHGSPVNFSGRFYNVSFYGVNPQTGRIDMDEVRRLALEIKPKLILAGFSAYPRELDFKKFREIADEVKAYLMVDMAHIAGLIAAKIHPDPMPYADIVTTTTHKTLRGPRAGLILCNLEDRYKELYRPESKKNLAQQIDSAVFPGNQGGPLEQIIAAKAVAFKEALEPSFVDYQKQIVANASVLAQTLMDEGFKLISDGTDNHLILMNLSDFPLSGKKAETALEDVGIYCNKNMVPDDKRPPTEASGIRLGTPALTTRGFKEDQIKIVGELIAKTLKNPESEAIKTDVKNQVSELVHAFPVYPELIY